MCVSMQTLLCYLAVTTSVTFAGNYTRRTCIIPTEPASDLQELASCSSCINNSDNNYNSRCLTLNELIDSVSKGQSVFQSQEEVFFLTGVHTVNGTTGQNLTVRRVDGLSIRGELDNVVIRCLEEFFFRFIDCLRINISHITFKNCTGHSNDNYTLFFERQTRSIVLDQLQIISQHGAGVAVYMAGDFTSFPSIPLRVSLMNSKLSTGKTGLFVGYSLTFLGEHSSVYVENTTLIGSCLEFQAAERFGDDFNVTIKNITINKCTCWSALTLRGANFINFNIVLQDVKMGDNGSPYLVYANQTSVYMTGSSSFHRNQGVMYLARSKLIFSWAKVVFVNSTVLTSHGVPVLATESEVVFENSCVSVRNNHGVNCGGITAKSRTQLNFKVNTTVTFEHNSGEKGGALSLHDESVMVFTATNVNTTSRHTMLIFRHNEARRGGAIFVEDSGYINTFSRKLITTVFGRIGTNNNANIQFSHNVAQIGGNSIYGGWVDWSVSDNGTVIYNPNISNVLSFKSDNKDVASDPIRVCLCTNGFPNCSIIEHRMEIFGHAFNLSMVAVGQRHTPVIEFVEARLYNASQASSRRMINMKQKVQIVQRTCTTLRYTIIQPNTKEIMNVFPLSKDYSPRFDSKQLHTHPDYDLLFQQLSVKVTIKPCPLGFKLHNTNGNCVCRQSLMSIGLQCHLDVYRISRSGQQWVGVTDYHTTNGEYPGIIVHQHCPFDYCRTDNDSLLIRLEDPDEQCAFNRSGILCGGCQTDLSKVLGSSRCKKCTNIKTIAIFPTFLIVGLLLVVFLMLLNLTVSVGTINGLTFYANVIRAQHATFFTPEISHSFLSKFIAWLNLDQGIESCFYNGFNTYISTWLQFLFPLYIWLIAAALIVTSHYSTRVSKLIGRNAVQVLATLFLISYTKLLRLVIDVISFTTITYPDGYKKTVWLIDGNVEFFQGRHIPLVLVTVVFILLSLPYTFILLTIQFLYKISHYRVMFWVQRLKPFFDAYTGPYRANHRYWTGLLLVARIALLVTFSVNQHNNISINLLAIITVSVLLLGWLSSAHWVYESPLNNFLEIFFLCNIIVTSAAVSFNLYNQRNNPAAIYISTSVTLVIYVGIILYHALRQLLLTRFGSRMKVKILNALLFLKFQDTNGEFSVAETRQLSDSGACESTTAVVESSRGAYKSYNSRELKEPLLEEKES